MSAYQNRTRRKHGLKVRPAVEYIKTLVVPFLWCLRRSRRDLERKLSEFQGYYNVERVHASLDGKTPSDVTVGDTVKHADINDLRWVSHCRDLLQLPMAA